MSIFNCEKRDSVKNAEKESVKIYQKQYYYICYF